MSTVSATDAQSSKSLTVMKVMLFSFQANPNDIVNQAFSGSVTGSESLTGPGKCFLKLYSFQSTIYQRWFALCHLTGKFILKIIEIIIEQPHERSTSYPCSHFHDHRFQF